jgi:hypothetical protein
MHLLNTKSINESASTNVSNKEGVKVIPLNNNNSSESADVRELEEDREADKKKSIVKVENVP